MRALSKTLRRPAPKVARLLLFALLAAVLGAAVGCGDEATEKQVEVFDPREYGEWEYDGQPQIDGPNRVVFGDMLEGESAERVVEVTNVGRAMLELGEWRVEGPFELSFPLHNGSPPVELRPGKSVEATISYTAHTTDRAQGRLDIESNDPDRPLLSIDLFANADFPCLDLQPADELDFGTAELGETSSMAVRATNCATRSPTQVRVEVVAGDEEFELLDSSLRGDVTLDAGESIDIPIGFHPEEPGEYEGVVQLISNDEQQPRRSVDLTGTGQPYGCPEAVIRAHHPDRGEAIANPTGHMQTVPLDTIELDASLSHDPEGSGISRVEWRLVQRPDDSNNELEQDSDSESNALWMQLSGVYEVELDVWSENGVRSCRPASMTLEAISDKDVHVQLVWSTPSDPDETNNYGTDLDLHLLHPDASGRWNRSPWDCFWRNRNPDWGSVGDSSDDPSLDIDITTGAGPENINLDKPESGLTYNIGVYYFAANGFGTSYATVRIYLGGDIAFESSGKSMDNQEFWHVADLEWPSANIVDVDQMYSSFP